MDQLSNLSWPMICVGGFSFVVVVAGMIVWQVIQSRMEREMEANTKAGKGLAPIQHPEPLHAWVRAACQHLDRGASWVEEPPQKATTMLNRDWQIFEGNGIRQCLDQLARDQPTAWNGVRLFRVALAGVRAGYIDVATAWNGIRPVAQRLQQTYPSFDAIWTDYVAGYRAWRQLPADGSADDAQTIERLQYIAQARTQPPPVAYRAGI
jgi:hypothetical protein